MKKFKYVNFVGVGWGIMGIGGGRYNMGWEMIE